MRDIASIVFLSLMSRKSKRCLINVGKELDGNYRRNFQTPIV
jgi:hypothetical protein